LQFLIKGDFDKCAGGFYKPHWPQRKSCPLTGEGHTFSLLVVLLPGLPVSVIYH